MNDQRQNWTNLVREEYSKLVKLSIQMARRQGMPDSEGWSWPPRIPRALRRDIDADLERAEDQCGEWAVELRDIADAILKLLHQQPKTMNPYQQAVNDELVVSHIGIAKDTDDLETAKRKLSTLLDWHIEIATNPAVNGGFVLVPLSAKKDADRYQWLRDECKKYYGLTICKAGEWDLSPWCGDDPDGSIDEAMLSSKGNDND